jgi:hypothetical protein
MMRRLRLLLVLGVYFFCFNPVLAQSPTISPNPAALPTGQATKPDNYLMAEQVGTIPFPDYTELVDTYIFKPLGIDLKSMQLKLLAYITLQVSPSANTTKETKLSGLTNQFFGALPALTPHTLLEKSVPSEDPRNTQTTGRLCIYNDNGTLANDDIVSNSPFGDKNPNPQNIKGLDQTMKYMGSIFTRGKVVSDSNGNYNYGRQALAMDTKQALPCPQTKDEISTLINRDETINSDEASIGTHEFGSGNNLTKSTIDRIAEICATEFNIPLLNITMRPPCHNYPVFYVSSELSPHIVEIDKNATGGIPGEESQVDYEVDAAEINSGGIINQYRPSAVSFDDGNYNGGDDNQCIDVNGTQKCGKSSLRARGKIQQGLAKSVCMMTPHSLQQKIIPQILADNYDPKNINGNLAQNSGNTDVLAAQTENLCQVTTSLPGSTGSCQSGNITIPGSSVCKFCASGYSPAFQNVVSTVAEKFNIPVAVLLAAMKHEGAFDIKANDVLLGADKGTKYDFSDANVNKLIQCGVSLPNCPVQDVSSENCAGNKNCNTAVWGFGEIPSVFWSDAKLWGAVQKIDPTRTKDKINPCNFLDVLAAMASELMQWSSYPRSPDTCYNERPMTNSQAPSSCNDPVWNDNVIVQSFVGFYIGSTPWCPDGETNPPAGSDQALVKVPTYADDVLGFYDRYQCH